MNRVEKAVEKFSESLLRLAFTYTKNMEDAEDLVQDAFVTYMTKAPEFLTSEHEKAWLIRITINICKNHLTSAKIKKREDLDENLHTEDSYSSGLFDAVNELPEKYRTAIHLYYYEGYSQKEIGKIVGITESAVASRISRGKEMLRERIGDDFS